MVRAILEGRKTQTRRLNGLDDVNKQPDIWTVHDIKSQDYMVKSQFKGRYGASFHTEELQPQTLHVCPQLCPYGQPGDKLWVRECFSYQHGCDKHDLASVWYWADNNPEDGDWTKPKPSIHMPRFASRITLEVVNVRAERLHDMKLRDYEAEGYLREPVNVETALERWQGLWDGINGKGNHETNPWVWVVEFKRVA